MSSALGLASVGFPFEQFEQYVLTTNLICRLRRTPRTMEAARNSKKLPVFWTCTVIRPSDLLDGYHENTSIQPAEHQPVGERQDVDLGMRLTVLFLRKDAQPFHRVRELLEAFACDLECNWRFAFAR